MKLSLFSTTHSLWQTCHLPFPHAFKAISWQYETALQKKYNLDKYFSVCVLLIEFVTITETPQPLNESRYWIRNKFRHRKVKRRKIKLFLLLNITNNMTDMVAIILMTYLSMSCISVSPNGKDAQIVQSFGSQL